MNERKSTFRIWWQIPRKYGVDLEDRRVTFLELFYDLVYVVVIAELAHSLSKHISLEGFLEFAFLFVLVWWAWFNGTLYHDLHGNNDVRTRIFTFMQMAAVVSMAVFAHNALDEGFTGFALSYAFFQLILTYMWYRTGYYDPDHRVASNPYSFVFLVVTIMFGTSVFIPEPFNLYFWIAGALLGLLLPVFLMPKMAEVQETAHRTEVMSPSAVERFGLFTIIVLGEVIVGVTQGLAEVKELSLEVGITAFLGLFIGIGVWWLYFDSISHHPPIENFLKGNVWAYLHLFMTMSISALGAVILNIIEHTDHHVSSEVLWFLIGSLIMILVTILAMTFTIQIADDLQVLYQRVRFALLASIIIILATGFVELSNILLLVVHQIAILIPIIYGVYIWVNIQLKKQTRS